MTSLSYGLLATIQHIKEYFALISSQGEQQIAIPPAWINSSVLSAHLQDKAEMSPQQQLRHAYEVSQFTNKIVQHPHIWDSTGEALDEIVAQVLSGTRTEITEAFLEEWQDAQYKLTGGDHMMTNLEGADFLVTQLDDTPSWQQIKITEAMFDGLVQRAREDEEFTRVFELIKVTDFAEDIDVKEISFEVAYLEVERPWFEEAVLESRQWRIKEGANIDGKTYLSSDAVDKSYDGALPGYLSSLIAIKNLNIAYTVVDESGGDTREDEEDTRKEQVPIFFGPLVLNSINNRALTTLAASRLSLDQIRSSAKLEQISRLQSTQWTSLQALEQAGVSQQLQLDPKFREVKITDQAKLSNGLKIDTSRLSSTFTGSTLSSRGLASSKETKQAEVQIRVVNEKGKPIRAAEINIRQIDSAGKFQHYFVKTGANGNARIGLGAGSAKIQCVAAGYVKQEQTIKLQAGTTSSLSFQLSPPPIKEVKDTATDIQLLAVVYKKLGTSPNPIADFKVIDETIV